MPELSAKWCRYYTGYATGEKCRAGVAYATVMTTDPKAVKANAVRTFSLPCLDDAGAMTCPECVRRDEPLPKPATQPFDPFIRGTHAPKT